MTNKPVTNRVAANLVRIVVIGMVVQLAVIAYVFYSAYARRVDMTHNSRVGCERGKLDRKDNADFQTAQKEYITSVTAAASVKEDVKTAARKAIITFDRTSWDLTKRSKIDCAKAYPDPTLFP